VQEDGSIHVDARELAPGTPVDVIVLRADGQDLPPIDEILAGYGGGRLFRTADEVDRYIRTERDAWDH
jgi:hypothetical protein